MFFFSIRICFWCFLFSMGFSLPEFFFFRLRRYSGVRRHTFFSIFWGVGKVAIGGWSEASDVNSWLLFLKKALVFSYCWWMKKSQTTTWDAKKLVNHGIFTTNLNWWTLDFRSINSTKWNVDELLPNFHQMTHRTYSVAPLWKMQ